MTLNIKRNAQGKRTQHSDAHYNNTQRSDIYHDDTKRNY